MVEFVFVLFGQLSWVIGRTITKFAPRPFQKASGLGVKMPTRSVDQLSKVNHGRSLHPGGAIVRRG